jgi:hypothetical protein
MELSAGIEPATPSLPRKYSTTEPREHFPGKNGAGEEIRTLDIHLGRVALYQLSYARIKTKKTNQKLKQKNGGVG